MIGKIFTPKFVPFESSLEMARRGGEKTPRTHSLFENKRSARKGNDDEAGRPMTQQTSSRRDSRATLKKRIEEHFVAKFGETANQSIKEVVAARLSLDASKIKA